MVQESGLTILGFTSMAFLASGGGVWFSIRLANRLGVMDVPNERSSHTIPIPRMGGVPMVLAIVLSFGLWILFAGGEPFSIKGVVYTVFFAMTMAILGFWDDISRLSPLLRFLVQFAGAVPLLWVVTSRVSKVIIIGVDVPVVAVVVIGAVWAVWMLNLYNFMDGIDGLAGGEAVVASSFFFLAFTYYGEAAWAVANLFIAAAAMGFLIYNWPPARVFMGDGGSAFLGAFYGMQSVVALFTTPIPFPVIVLPFANFILDTTFTLFRRVVRGEKWYQAHRSHYYQRMTNIGMTHKKVTSLELSAVAASCVVAAGCMGSEIYLQIALVATVIAGLTGIGLWIAKKEYVLKHERT